MSKLDIQSRNILINGGMHLFQRTTGATLPAGNPVYITADRFRIGFTGTITGTASCGRSTSVPSNGKSPASLVVSLQRNASPASIIVAQRVESLNAQELSGEFTSLSFSYRTPTATIARINFKTPSGTDNYATSSTFFTRDISIVADNTWRESKIEAIHLPDVGVGFEIEIVLMIPTGTDSVGTDHFITQIKLNAGRKARAFTMAGNDVVEETDKCFRYYEIGLTASSGTASSTYSRWNAVFRVPKRVVPAVTYEILAGQNGASANVQGTNQNGAYGWSNGGSINDWTAWAFKADAEI